MNDLKAFTADLRDQIAQNQSARAINHIIEKLCPIEGPCYNAALQLKAQQQQNEQAVLMGTVDKNQESIQQNRLGAALLQLLDDIENNARVIQFFKQGVSESQLQSTKKRVAQVVGSDTPLAATKKRTSPPPLSSSEFTILVLECHDRRVQGMNAAFQIEKEAVIGRSPECDIVVDFEFVSRKHARISRSQGQYYLEDLASSNGSFQNGQAIQKTILQAGDLLKFDEVEFKVLEIK